MDRDKRYEYLVDRCRGMSDDELSVLELVAEGINRGQHTYGSLDVGRDRRSFHWETLEEIRDALVYVGAALVKLKDHGA